MSFENGDLVFYSPLALPNISPTDFNSHKFWKVVFLVQDPWTGELNVGIGLLIPQGGPLSCDFPPTCRSLHQGCGPC